VAEPEEIARMVAVPLAGRWRQLLTEQQPVMVEWRIMHGRLGYEQSSDVKVVVYQTAIPKVKAIQTNEPHVLSGLGLH